VDSRNRTTVPSKYIGTNSLFSFSLGLHMHSTRMAAIHPSRHEHVYHSPSTTTTYGITLHCSRNRPTKYGLFLVMVGCAIVDGASASKQPCLDQCRKGFERRTSVWSKNGFQGGFTASDMVKPRETVNMVCIEYALRRAR
jgi:hypothetical protein